MVLQLKPLPSIDLLRVNPPTYDGAEDIADLTYLNEASVVHNIKTRYYDDSIYASLRFTGYVMTMEELIDCAGY